MTPCRSHMVLISPRARSHLEQPGHSIYRRPTALNISDSAQGWPTVGRRPADLTDPLVSPLYGSLAGLPPTAVYAGRSGDLSPPMCLSSKTMPWRRRVPTSPSSSATAKYTTGRSSDHSCPRQLAVLPDIYRQLGISSGDAARLRVSRVESPLHSLTACSQSASWVRRTNSAWIMRPPIASPR